MLVDTPVNMPSEYWSTYQLIIGRDVDRVSADMLTDMSVDTQPIVTVGSRPTGALSTHDPLNVVLNGMSANQEQVFLLLDQSGVSNFAFSERKIEKKMPSVTTNEHSVILPSML